MSGGLPAANMAMPARQQFAPHSAAPMPGHHHHHHHTQQHHHQQLGGPSITAPPCNPYPQQEAACYGPPQAGANAGFGLGTNVEVWSNSNQKWCKGRVEQILSATMVTASFVGPNGVVLHKNLAIVHGANGEIRLPRGNQSGDRPLLAMEAIVDSECDVFFPIERRKKVFKISSRACHGGDLPLSVEEHCSTTVSSSHFQKNPRASEVANTIVQQAMLMGMSVVDEFSDCYDREWQPQYDPLAQLFAANDCQTVGTKFAELSQEVGRILASQPSLNEVSVPAKIYGDIHGHFRDMLLLLHNYGFPNASASRNVLECFGSNKTFNLVFNGDWCDRGAHQLEVVALVLALKAVYPDQVFLNRGNHEDPQQNTHMAAVGLLAQCQHRLGEALGNNVFRQVHRTFEYLPLGTLIDNMILVVHGGIGDGQWDLSLLRSYRRPASMDEIQQSPALYNILWSDPIPDDETDPDEIFGVHDSPRDGHRKTIISFGKDCTDAFCERNNLEMIVRSHQAFRRGCGYEVMHGGRCMRVFSARDYENMGNDGAVLSVEAGTKQPGMPHHLVVRPQVVRSLQGSSEGRALTAQEVTPAVKLTAQRSRQRYVC